MHPLHLLAEADGVVSILECVIMTVDGFVIDRTASWKFSQDHWFYHYQFVNIPSAQPKYLNWLFQSNTHRTTINPSPNLTTSSPRYHLRASVKLKTGAVCCCSTTKNPGSTREWIDRCRLRQKQCESFCEIPSRACSKRKVESGVKTTPAQYLYTVLAAVK